MDWTGILVFGRYRVQILAEYRLCIMHLSVLNYMYRIRSEQITMEHNIIKYSYSYMFRPYDMSYKWITCTVTHFVPSSRYESKNLSPWKWSCCNGDPSQTVIPKDIVLRYIYVYRRRIVQDIRVLQQSWRRKVSRKEPCMLLYSYWSFEGL